MRASIGGFQRKVKFCPQKVLKLALLRLLLHHLVLVPEGEYQGQRIRDTLFLRSSASSSSSGTPVAVPGGAAAVDSSSLNMSASQSTLEPSSDSSSLTRAGISPCRISPPRAPSSSSSSWSSSLMTIISGCSCSRLRSKVPGCAEDDGASGSRTNQPEISAPTRRLPPAATDGLIASRARPPSPLSSSSSSSSMSSRRIRRRGVSTSGDLFFGILGIGGRRPRRSGEIGVFSRRVCEREGSAPGVSVFFARIGRA
ncbi:hypothetical protein BRADI_2g43491v3 [Brachypodium distachyon]|uniref:Uncharacterized protein n=1 Tax=Brachypodium distachyon TaxID=15368 RepID=A0A0Q3KCK4_BRADI|nr:hypothetical protein BRADI_2g43491v3 [Brachypodium distachyon]